MKYVYPAVFSQYGSDVGVYFPDLDGCISQGENYLDAFRMAREGLSLHLYGMTVEGYNLPVPGRLEDISLKPNQALALIESEDIDDFKPDWELEHE